jgi:hypothetical protein
MSYAKVATVLRSITHTGLHIGDLNARTGGSNGGSAIGSGGDCGGSSSKLSAGVEDPKDLASRLRVEKEEQEQDRAFVSHRRCKQQWQTITSSMCILLASNISSF